MLAQRICAERVSAYSNVITAQMNSYNPIIKHLFLCTVKTAF